MALSRIRTATASICAPTSIDARPPGLIDGATNEKVSHRRTFFLHENLTKGNFLD